MMAPFHAEHGAIRLDPQARSPKNTMIVQGQHAWEVKQILCDAEDDNDWVIECSIDLARSREESKPVLRLLRIGS